MAEVVIGRLIEGALLGGIINKIDSGSSHNTSETIDQTSTTAPFTNYQTSTNDIYSTQDYNYNYYQNLNSYEPIYQNKNDCKCQNNNKFNRNNRFIQSAYGVKKFNNLEIKIDQHRFYLNRRSPNIKIYKMKILKLNYDLNNKGRKGYLSPKKDLNANINKIVNFPKNQANEVDKIHWKKLLGKGGFGEVYEIIFKGYKYAGKKIHKDNLAIEELKQALQREISILTMMNKCNNSVKFYKHLEDEYYHILILELCDTDLKHFIDQSINGLNENMIYYIMKQLNNTFIFFYKEKIIHRDIKPENILIKYEDNYHKNIIPKMSDYGISRICNEASTPIGTRNYTAPEILLGKRYNSKVDLYSIGVMMYYMHFKEFPFGNLNLMNKYSINTLLNRKKNKSCKNYLLDDLINKLLVYDPENRISWVEYFNHPFFNKN